MPPEKFDPRDDDRGADHRVEWLEGLLLAEPRDLLDQELEIGLDRTEIDVLGITSRHGWVVIIWPVGSRQSRGNGVSQLRREAWRRDATSWLTQLTIRSTMLAVRRSKPINRIKAAAPSRTDQDRAPNGNISSLTVTYR